MSLLRQMAYLSIFAITFFSPTDPHEITGRTSASSGCQAQTARNPQGYDAAIVEAEAALKAGNNALAARKYAEAADLAPTKTDLALKVAQMLMDTKQYLDAAALATRARDTTSSDVERKTAAQLIEKLQPEYQKSADLKFVDALRQVKAGNAKEALPVFEKVRRLVCDPQEGLITLCFVEYGAGNTEASEADLKEWINSGHHSPFELASTRLATYYNPYMVMEALANDDIHEMLVKAFGKYSTNRLERVVEDGRSAEEPTIKTINPKDGAIMLQISAGKFIMGDRGIANNPRRTISLSEYWIYEKLVTVDMYRKYCKATGKQMPPEPVYTGFHFNPHWKNGNHPIVNVSWPEAVAYCTWAGTALPTEAQWEKAARGTDGRRYPWGSQWNPHLLHHSNDDGDARGTAPVGSFPGGASPYGALDMAGMVFQWCSDYYLADYWRYAPQSDPTGPNNGKDRVVKSGSWYDDDDVDFVAARRTNYPPKQEYIYAGFRCAAKP